MRHSLRLVVTILRALYLGEDWACLVEFLRDEPHQQLSRRIITFRQVGDAYRRHEENHRQQLFDAKRVTHMLQGIGFEVRPVQNYGAYRLAEHVAGFVAKKPL